MTRRFEARWDVLPAAQQRLWPQLRNAPGLGFTLYGGTAIALRFGAIAFGRVGEPEYSDDDTVLVASVACSSGRTSSRAKR